MSTAQAQSLFNFDEPAARQAKLKGMQRVESKCDPDWFAQMVEVGRQVAWRNAEVTTDMIVQEYAQDPTRPTTSNMRAMSGVMRKLVDLRILEITDRFVNSVRVKQHRCPIRVYKSLVYRGGV